MQQKMMDKAKRQVQVQETMINKLNSINGSTQNQSAFQIIEKILKSIRTNRPTIDGDKIHIEVQKRKKHRVCQSQPFDNDGNFINIDTDGIKEVCWISQDNLEEAENSEEDNLYSDEAKESLKNVIGMMIDDVWEEEAQKMEAKRKRIAKKKKESNRKNNKNLAQIEDYTASNWKESQVGYFESIITPEYGKEMARTSRYNKSVIDRAVLIKNMNSKNLSKSRSQLRINSQLSGSFASSSQQKDQSSNNLDLCDELNDLITPTVQTENIELENPDFVQPESDQFKFNDSLQDDKSPSLADSGERIHLVLNNNKSQIENYSGVNFKTPDQEQRVGSVLGRTECVKEDIQKHINFELSNTQKSHIQSNETNKNSTEQDTKASFEISTNCPQVQEFNETSEQQEFHQAPLHKFEQQEANNSELSFEEVNCDNAVEKTLVSPTKEAFKKYDQKQMELMKQVFANRKCLDDSDSSDSFGEKSNQSIHSISSGGPACLQSFQMKQQQANEKEEEDEQVLEAIPCLEGFDMNKIIQENNKHLYRYEAPKQSSQQQEFDGMFNELVIDEDDDFDFESDALNDIQAIANKALGRNLNHDEEPNVFEHYELEVENVDKEVEVDEDREEEEFIQETKDFLKQQIQQDSLSPIKGSQQQFTFESIQEDIEAENKSDSEQNSQQDMSFEVQSIANPKTRRVSAEYDDVQINHHSTLEVKNELGSSEVDQDAQSKHSFAMSLEMLAGQIEQKKQQLESQQSVTGQSMTGSPKSPGIEKSRSRSNSGTTSLDNNPIVCFSASSSEEFELSDSQRSGIQKQKSLIENEGEKETANRVLESDENIYNFTLSGISVNSDISQIQKSILKEEVVTVPKRGAYKSKLDRIQIAKKMNQSVDTANEDEEHKEPFQSKLLNMRATRNTQSQVFSR